MAKVNYSLTFDATTSWSATSDGYEIVVTADTHGMGSVPCAEVWQADGEDLYKAVSYPSNGYRIVINDVGTVTLEVSDSGRFAGKIVIADATAGGSISIDALTTPATQNALQEKINEIIASLTSWASSPPYQASFSIDEWMVETNGYYLSFPISLHEHETVLFVDVWELEGENFVQTSGLPSIGYKVVIATNGDITLHTGAEGRFAGKIIIR